ncbi:MAG: hypothetical protein IID33_12795 [Planctomycetes bacterium]|nr:hypothetical protein [Planctomycetota bacterium]
MPKKRFASLTALGGKPLPPEIEVSGHRYVQRRVFKDDFFAVTALYEGEAGKVILKIQRQAPFLLIPMTWVGRWLVGRELSSFERLRGVEGIPEVIAPWGKTGMVRRYVEGHPLARGERVADDFHARLRSLIDTMHDRGMAYVDLEKSENVLVGEDGRPHLFDFQISWHLPRKRGGELWPMRVVRRWLQRGDLYHLRKLQRRTRPDQLSPEELALSYRRPWYVRVHRFVTYPFTFCRRLVLDRIDPRRDSAMLSRHRRAGAYQAEG